MVKAVVFDLDGTLYEYEDLNRKAVEHLCAFTRGRLGVSREEFFRAFEKAREDTKAVLDGTGAAHSRMLYCQKTLENLGERPASLALEMYEAYWGYMLDHMEPREGAEELFRYCREREIRIGVCTDLTAHIQHRKLKRLGLDGWVDVLVTSEEAGAEKPSPAIYRLLLEKLGTAPEEVLFVGDSYTKDVEGPRAAGMKAVWFCAGQAAGDESARLGGGRDGIVGTMGEIKEVIDAL